VHAKIGQLTLENDLLEGALGKAGLLPDLLLALLDHAATGVPTPERKIRGAAELHA